MPLKIKVEENKSEVKKIFEQSQRRLVCWGHVDAN